MSVTYHALCGLGCFLEHAAFVFLGLLMMIAGLGLAATIIMMPMGILVGMLGVAAVVGGIFGRLDKGQTGGAYVGSPKN